ncbi:MULTISPECIES: aldo/keto reductase [unclassified Bacillus (in: firmicutes)]|uniref:aldo/keto reductase n=1 Tax=unclassified Bacillus (in: firmicutes) TaxID=185979 RepID=UPI000BEFF81D|nr:MULTISPECIES: aldo/keto reductase [unclassified Bacillus (in: firmicutes)]PEJ56490.1 aldo/keto reductase [Bacillus sp. AFS002410]PEL08023.1 aldo/keto reductase [Bacillus sp. AFS017336]
MNNLVKLNNGLEMPIIGLGVFQVEDGQVVIDSVKAAIRNGYRSIDTAAIYQNEEGVGQGIKEALEENGLKREDLFITSKVWNADLGYQSTIDAFELSLKKLGLDYLDLYLIHWPVEGKYVESWKALETLYKDGKVKAIGMSNFQIHHLKEVMATAEIMPMVNQVELHPMLSQVELREFLKENSIQVEAWAPLMQGGLFENETLLEIANKHNKSIAQVVLRWHLQNGIVIIPKSIKEHRIQENANLFDFELTQEDMEQINSLNQNHRVGPDPDNFDF